MATLTQKAVLLSVGTYSAKEALEKIIAAEYTKREVEKIAAYDTGELTTAAEYETKTITEYRAQVIADNAEITAAIEEIEKSKLTGDEKATALAFLPPLETAPVIPTHKTDEEWQTIKLSELAAEQTEKEDMVVAAIEADSVLKTKVDNLEPEIAVVLK